MINDSTYFNRVMSDCVQANPEKIQKLREEMAKEAKMQFLADNIANSMPKYTAKADKGKAQLSLVPRRIIWDIAKIREYGNNKYPEGGPDNWKSVNVQRYRDAAMRHFLKYLDDPQGCDEESGLPHIWHLACNVAFLCEMEDSLLKAD